MKLGFGAWQLGGECTFGGRQTGWGKLDKAEALKTIEEAIQAGVTFFDTAPGYGKGQSESILGEVFSANATSTLQICTKYGSFEDSDGKAYLDFSASALFSSVEKSLERLKTDRLHTLLLHGPADDFDYSTFDPTPFEELKKQKLIKHYGVSVKSLKGAIHVVNAGFGDSLEAIFNVLDRRVEDYIFNQSHFTKEYNFIARVPLASGFLSSSFLNNKKTHFEPTDIRSSIHKNDLNWYQDSVEKLRFLEELPGGISVSALRYVLHHPAVKFAIPGTRSRAHLSANLAAVELGPLPQSITTQIKNVLPFTNPNWIF